jgi:NADH-quinone oxidoreductase subunit D
MERETLVLNMGPQHPSTHGVLRVVLELDGEVVVKAIPHIGYLHRGVEKLAEFRSYEQFLPFTDRFDYVAATSNNLAYVRAVEKLGDIAVPVRAQFMRVALAELSRISSHLIWLATHVLDLGAITPLFYMFREREEIRDIFEMICGARMTHSFLRIGGLRNDVSPEAQDKLRKFIDSFPAKVSEYEALITKNPIFLKRTQGIGVIDGPEAINLGLTGPALRASGVDWDLRKEEPYEVYGEMEFDVPVLPGGDTYDRFLVRLEEMHQSCRIIRQVLDKAPEGEIRAVDQRYIRPDRERVHEHMEDLIRYCYLAQEGPPMPAGEVYTGIEGPKGEIGFYIVSDGSPKPVRLKLRPPCFVNLSALSRLVEGSYIADVVSVIGSVDIVLGEVDR